MNFRSLIASIVSSRARLASIAGITYGGKRDIFAVCGYDRILIPQMYRERYRRNAVAGRIVEAKPQATWRGGAEVIEDEDPDTFTEFEKEWELLETRLKIWSILQRADIVAGLGQYGVILIGAPGDISTPLPRMEGPDNIGYLQVFAEEDALISEWDRDPLSPRWGLPQFYILRRVPPFASTGQTVPFSTVGRKAHWSRCIHIADGLLDDNVYATPRLERVWNLLDDLEKVTGGGAEAFWKRADAGIQLNVDPELDFDEKDEEKTEQQLDDYLHKFRRSILTRGIEAKNLGSQVANFKGPMDAIISQISAGTGIPQRILMGSERGELASNQDRDNWAERVTDRRNAFAGPLVVKQLVDRFIDNGVLPQPSKFEVRWPEIKNLDVLQRAQVAAIWAQLNTLALEKVVDSNEIRDRLLDLPYREFPVMVQALPQQQGSADKQPSALPAKQKKLPAAATMFARKWAVLSVEKRRQILDQLPKKPNEEIDFSRLSAAKELSNLMIEANKLNGNHEDRVIHANR